MQAIIDFGNTNVKIITNQDIIYLKNTKDKEVILRLNVKFKQMQITEVLIVNVGIKEQLLKYLNIEYKIFKNKDILDYIKFIKDVNLFGADRIANIYAHKLQNRNSKNFIIFDFGTYLTIDVVTNCSYQEGKIMLGVSRHLQQICLHSENLKQTPQQILQAQSMDSTSGQIKFGLVEQYNFLVSMYAQNYPQHEVIITGHDLELVATDKYIVNENILINLLNLNIRET